MTDFDGLLSCLHDNRVHFILVGGFAGTVLGSRAAGRPKDLEAIAGREALLDEGAPPD